MNQKLLHYLGFLFCTSLLISCTPQPNISGSICGKYNLTALHQNQSSNVRPFWLNDPGETCAVGSANWGNSTKNKAVEMAAQQALGFIANELTGAKVQVNSTVDSQITVHNNDVTSSFQQGVYQVKSEGKAIKIKYKQRAIWYEGYRVWVLVERIE